MVEDFTTINENAYEDTAKDRFDSKSNVDLTKKINAVSMSMEKTPSIATIEKLLLYSQNFK